jgi:uncharacterized protein YndB with AHSA1/START domain
MLIQPQAPAHTSLEVDRATLTITLRRTFAAPREQVFEAWTQPEHVACWWDPTGNRLVECEIDLRLGGSFKFVNANHGPPFSGTYREIAPPARLVFDAMGAVGTVNLDHVRGETLMTVTIKCGSPGHFEQFLQLGVADGTARTLDNLVAYVGAKKT